MKTDSRSYPEQLAQRFADLRAETRRLEADAATHPPASRMRTLEECVPPNPHAIRAAEDVAACQDPHIWPGYDPYGAPANGHAIALGIRHLLAEDAATAAASPATMLYDEHGIPDPYKTALAARSRR